MTVDLSDGHHLKNPPHDKQSTDRADIGIFSEDDDIFNQRLQWELPSGNLT